MSKLKIVPFLIMIATFSHLIYAKKNVCCRKTTLFFASTSVNNNCSQFKATRHTSPFRKVEILYENRPQVVCKIKVCGNGKPRKNNNYCGIGKCNRIGCKCHGGCILGNSFKNFKAIHGNDVIGVH